MSLAIQFYIRQLLLFFTICVFSMSLYLQYVEHFLPCPLCIMQRLCVLILLLFFIAQCMIKRLQAMVYCVIPLIISSCGLFFALRQINLQWWGTAAPHMCLPSLQVLMTRMPWHATMSALLWGGSDCAESTGKWLGLELPQWAAGYFILILLGTIVYAATICLHQDKQA